MTPMGPDDERRLLAAVQDVTEAADGLGPTAAVVKVARDRQLGPGAIRLLAHAYNSGRQLAQWAGGGDVLTKLAEYPLADAAAAIRAVFPDDPAAPPAPVKAAVDADWRRPPHWLDDRYAREKVAALRGTPTALVKRGAAAPAAPPDRSADLAAAYADLGRVKAAHAEASRLASAAYDRLTRAVGAVVAYFGKAAYDRCPLALAEANARTAHGPAVTPLFDLAAARLPAPEPRYDPARPPAVKSAFDLAAGREAAALVAAAVKAAAEAYTLRAAATALAGPAQAAADLGRRPLAKEAFGAAGSAGGLMYLASLARPKGRDELVEDSADELDDPAHLNELRRIRARSMLGAMLGDPDDPISGHDPDQVVGAYNELAQVAPRAAEQPAIMRPLLRRRLVGNTEPFEAKELTEIERGLADTRSEPTLFGGRGAKNASLLA